MDRRRVLGLLAAAGLPAGAAGARPAGLAARGGFNPRDLSGIWSNGSYTVFERPKELPRLVLTPAEAEAFEAPLRALHGMPVSKEGTVGQAESEFNERGSGLLRIRGEIRASLIVDPADGQIPWRPDIRARYELDKRPQDRKDPMDANPEELNPFTRCLLAPGTTAPMIPGADTNVYEFVQTPDVLAIVSEKFHDTRIIPLTGPPDPHPLASWLGSSAGRWAGEALVVETAGFGPGVVLRGAGVSPATRVTETFTRLAAHEILYGFTVDDETLYTRPWRGENLFVPAPGRLFEYACHEGNYGLPDILRIARGAEREAAAKGGR
jgi:hypothetical protein